MNTTQVLSTAITVVLVAVGALWFVRVRPLVREMVHSRDTGEVWAADSRRRFRNGAFVIAAGMAVALALQLIRIYLMLQ